MNLDSYYKIKKSLPLEVTLVAVSKTKPVDQIEALYKSGQIVFGENKVQEMCIKYESLPKDIQWHLIGHLQTNKVKFIAPFVSLIHAVDSLKLLGEIDKQAKKNDRIISCLLQIYIASEETKFGLDQSEALALLHSKELESLRNISIKGLMGMATNTNDTAQIENEFINLNRFFKSIQAIKSHNCNIQILSMGMSSDYVTAIKCGSNMVRIGSSIFGSR